MIRFKRFIKKFIMLFAAIKSASFLPAYGQNTQVYKTPVLASIAATVKNKKLKAFAPSADDNKYNYKWKIFKDGKQIGETISGVEINSELDSGDYNLQLAIEEKNKERTISFASVDIHAS